MVKAAALSELVCKKRDTKSIKHCLILFSCVCVIPYLCYAPVSLLACLSPLKVCIPAASVSFASNHSVFTKAVFPGPSALLLK